MFWLGVTAAHAAIYHIDFAGGDDENDGLSPRTAWKHCPGDRNAAGRVTSAELRPGDRIRFKGGVPYFGEIQWEASGTEGRPIVLDGNTDGTFGQGRAILDGARMITDWRRVEAPEQVRGNPKWREMMYADLDVDLASNFSQNAFVLHRDGAQDRQAPWQRLFLIDGEERVLPIAQLPKPSDPFYPDLPADFFTSPVGITNNYPHKIYYEKGSKGNRTLPLIAITYGGNAPVIEPFNGGAVSVEMAKPAAIADIGFRLYRPKSTPAPEKIVFLADDREVHAAKVDPDATALQRFKLPSIVKARKMTFRLQHSNTDKGWTKLQQIAAFTPGGDNLIEHELSSVIQDPDRFTGKDPAWHEGSFVGVHGGNNHVYFAPVRGYDPASHRLQVPHFSATTYDKTNYAFYNSPRLISSPGEWCLVPRANGQTRVYFLPEKRKNGPPVNIGYPMLRTALSMDGDVSHVEVRGFLMQRYAGGKGGVATNGRGKVRPSHIKIADCEVRFISGQSGLSLNHSDHLTVENCSVHHCPGWTVGIYVNRVNHYRLTGNRVDCNSGSGVRHYEARHGVLRNNVVLNHYGMHASGLNFYEGCADILFEGNYVQNVIAINRNAENLTFRNNVVDSQRRGAFSMAMWPSGSVGGREIKNLAIEKNTLVNADPDISWSSSIFVQSGASAPTGLVVRNNIIDRLRPPVPATIEDNLFLHAPDAGVAGKGSLVSGDPKVLFRDPDRGDFRRKAGGPMMQAGADIPPPPAKWGE